MKFHVVQVNERIKDIAKKYDVSLDEIIKLNRHINNMESIVPGMKIRLPILSDQVSDELKDNFLDIEKYYPKVEDFKEAELSKKNSKENDEQNDEALVEEESQDSQQTYYQPSQQPYYGQYQGQYYNPYQQQVQQPYYQTYQQPYYPNYQQPVQQQYYYPPQQPVQQPMNPYSQNIYNRNVEQPQAQVTKQEDLTMEEMKQAPNIESKFFNQPAFCDPVLLEGIETKPKTKKKEKTEYEKLFNNPLFNPPYPCNQTLEEAEEIPVKIQGKTPVTAEVGFDEEVKEIKRDLRDYVRKHTKVKKKKDSLNIL